VGVALAISALVLSACAAPASEGAALEGPPPSVDTPATEAPSTETPPSNQIEITDGVLVGEVVGEGLGEVVQFRGVPFAASTAGAGRWAPPGEVEAWDGALDATVAGPRCAQPATSPGTPAEVAPSDAEDCLVLDVTVPADVIPTEGIAGETEVEPAPVLVWIHGGGLRTGAGSDYTMARFAAEQRAIVVTPNYRLGALGFLDLPGLEGGGQFGLLDQQAALAWVQDNIEKFGGDPDRVTLAGESGGADAVCAQLASPEATGLFHRAIVQSGTCSDTNVVDAVIPGAGPAFSTWKSAATAQEVGAAFATAVGCTLPEEAVVCLRERPVSDIHQAALASGAYFSPTVGTGVLPRYPAEFTTDPDHDPVPLLTGWTADEGNIFAAGFSAQPLTDQSFAALLALAAGPAAAEAIAAYVPAAESEPAVPVPSPVPAPSPSPVETAPSAAPAPSAVDVSWNRLWAEVITDRAWICPNLAVDEAFAAEREVYVYEFADPDAPNVLTLVPPDLADGTLHGTELAYLFELNPGQPTLSPLQEELAREMRDAWGSFVRSGTPGEWPELGEDGAVHVLSPAGVMSQPVAEIRAEHRCSIWDG
jgi:para-nitrobenzyl esterase